MSLLSRIKAWLQPKPAPRPTAQTIKRPAANTPPVKPKAKPAAAPLPPATGVADSRVHVRVYYQNAVDHTMLHQPADLMGHPGERLPITWAVIPGFVLTAISGFTQVFPQTSQMILCRYSPRVAAPVMVYHRDQNGRLLQVPEVLTGVVNETFVATPLAEFGDHVVGESKQTGTFSATSQQLQFDYNLTPLERGKAPEEAYIQLKTAKLAYSAPLAGKPLRQALPANTFWRVYALMRDTNTHTVWLNVGGAQWITADDTLGQADNPFLPDPTPLALPHTLFTTDEVATNRRGVCIADATRWQAPFGQVCAKRLVEGQSVTITAIAELDNHSKWYRLADNSYVLATFIKLH
ncbi:MucBP domain-containing protein [Lacticaseibacillus sp. N501-2]|uniref:MucBP domain-containing protein n=1 Tax=Lacticaseibacillus salsurae TaxID=3367729 RepID=UPI0038B33A46